MANRNSIQEVNVEFDGRRLNISTAGIWVDTFNATGQPISLAVAWEELTSHEVQSFMSFYEVLQNSDRQAMQKAG